MRGRFGRAPAVGLVGLFVAVMLGAGTAWGQSSTDSVAGLAVAGVFLLVALLFGLAIYVYMALALQTIANKTGTRNAWLAWIPLANLFLMLDIAKKPLWWFVLFLIPLVNIVIVVMVWMGIAQAVRKPDWWGILAIIPLANLVVPGYLAWAD